MVDTPVEVDDVDGAQAALAAPAVRDHVDAGVRQGVEQRLFRLHVDGQAAVEDLHLERQLRLGAGIAEHLVAQPGRLAAAGFPEPLGLGQHRQWTADVELAVGRQRVDFGGKIDAPALCRDEELGALAQKAADVVLECQLVALMHPVDQAHRLGARRQRRSHAEDRGDADAAGNQQIVRGAPRQLEPVDRQRQPHRRALVEGPHELGAAPARRVALHRDADPPGRAGQAAVAPLGARGAHRHRDGDVGARLQRRHAAVDGEFDQPNVGCDGLGAGDAGVPPLVAALHGVSSGRERAPRCALPERSVPLQVLICSRVVRLVRATGPSRLRQPFTRNRPGTLFISLRFSMT